MRHLDAQLIHDMRNAVSVIRGAALQLGEEPLPPAAVQRLAEMIARRGDLLGHLLDDLATADSLERGDLAIVRQRVSLDEVCAQALEHRSLAGHVAVTVDAAPDAVALTDPTRLHQIVDNLVTNALRYGGPHVTVHAHREGDQVRVAVADDGDGIPDHLRDTLFDAFARGRGSTRAGGSGLGLSIVFELCEALGGSVDYAFDGGSRFTVTLPALPVATALPTDDPADRGHGVTFWYDEQSLLERTAGYAALGLTSGEAVLLAVTPSHGEVIERRLADVGIDVEAARACGQLVFVDADAVHDNLVHHGRIDAHLFEALIGAAVRGIESRWRSMRVFGEIVDLYWQRGDGHLAVELESCWNDLRRRHDFPLLCAYEVAEDAAVGELSDCHDAVVAA